jgi:hypothetical protein
MSCSYNLGRDWLVGNATAQSTILPTPNMTNTSTYSGQTSFNNYTYATTATYVSGLLQNSSNGINHYQSVAIDGSNAIDGLVAILTVKIAAKPTTTTSGWVISINDTYPTMLTAYTARAEWSNRPAGLMWTLFTISCAILSSLL